ELRDKGSAHVMIRKQNGIAGRARGLVQRRALYFPEGNRRRRTIIKRDPLHRRAPNLETAVKKRGAAVRNLEHTVAKFLFALPIAADGRLAHIIGDARGRRIILETRHT